MFRGKGEGSNTGLPVSFVRFAGCDFHCGFKMEDGTFVPDKKHPWRCDTQYSWDTKRYSRDWIELTEEEIVKRLDIIGCKNVVFSGGNPALQNLSNLINKLHDKEYGVQMETQGSIVKDWFKDIDFLTISPKPPSSGMDFNLGIFRKVLLSNKNREIKVVLNDTDEDLGFFKVLLKKFPLERFTIQILNTAPGSPNSLHFLINRYRKLIDKITQDEELIKKHNIHILPQVHALLWGNERGR